MVLANLYWYKATVVRIIDGDTIVIDIDMGCHHWITNEHVRLRGINTPEVRGAEKEKGLLAKAALTEILPPGTETVIHTERDKRGSFNRLLVDVYTLSGECVNTILVDLGFAEVAE